MAHRDLRRVARWIFEAGHLGHVALGRIVERQLTLVAQLEDRHRGEALRHRRDAEDRVGVDRRLRRHVAESGRAGVRELAVDDDAPRRARRVRLRRVVAQEPVDFGERGRQLGAIGLVLSEHTRAEGSARRDARQRERDRKRDEGRTGHGP